MDGSIAFFTLICLVLAIWALLKSYAVDSELRRRIRTLEQQLLDRPAGPGPAKTGESDKQAVDPQPYTAPLQAAKVRQPAAVAAPATLFTAPRPAPKGYPELRRLWTHLTGGNIFVRIGVLVLFFGIAFLLKYASEHHALPPEVRLACAGLTAVVLFALGWRLRRRSRGYALVLQGGGIGVMYLAVFASLRLYHLLPGGAVFLLLCLVVIWGMTLAVWQAVMSVLGGFLAPVLASTGGGSHVVLFSYYLVLNAGVLGVAFHRSWRGLNVLGFVCTFIIASAWGVLRYQPELFASTEPFLAAFFLMYTAIALLYALRQSVRLRYYADGTLIFGAPLVGFSLQSAMVHGWQYALAYSALALCLFYLALAALIHRLRGRDLRVLIEAFVALGIGFGTLAIPFALDAYWTSAAWALEGAGIAWSGLRQRRMLYIASGLLLQVASGVAFLLHDAANNPALPPVLNTETLGVALIAVAGLFSAWYLERCHRAPDCPGGYLYRLLSLYMLGWGVLWWAHGGIDEAGRLAPTDSVAHLHALLLFATLSLTLFSFSARRLDWADLGALAVLQTPVALTGLLALAALDARPTQSWGWYAWPLTLVISFVLLRHLQDRKHPQRYLVPWHSLSLLTAVTVVTWECTWRLRPPHDPIWHLPVSSLLPALVLLALATRARRWLPWPVDRYAPAYTGWAAFALALFLWLWLLRITVDTDSSHSAFAYLPLLNPLDATQALALTGLALWVLALRRGDAGFGAQGVPIGSMAFCVGFAVFACLNGTLIRSLCYWLPLRFDWDALVDSQVVQMSVSILWTLCALGLMVVAARRHWRRLWFAGATLMTAEIGKLFILDLASAGSLERIVSFIVVGGLLLLIGYFSPLPPARA